jgi:ribosomal protein S18 acetylase RimI-like enzyme
MSFDKYRRKWTIPTTRGENGMIRPLEKNDPLEVKELMAGFPLQFPRFVVDPYSERWNKFVTRQDYKLCGYYVSLASNGTVNGHAGYIFNEGLGLYEIVGVVVSVTTQRQGIGRALIYAVLRKLRELGAGQVILYTLGHAGNENTILLHKGINCYFLWGNKIQIDTSK